MSLEGLAFFVLAALTLVSGVLVISHRKAIISALALAFNLVSIAGMFLLLEAQFLAFLQVIVYAGAIMVLILFVIMLLNVQDEQRLLGSGIVQRALAPLLAAVLVALLFWTWSGTSSSFPAAGAGYGTVESVGIELFRDFYYPFEAISLLLLVAMIGAVLLAKRRL